MEQSKQEKEIYELAELLMQSESLEASAIILRDFAENVTKKVRWMLKMMRQKKYVNTI